jgi:hypothetical protein
MAQEQGNQNSQSDCENIRGTMGPEEGRQPTQAPWPTSSIYGGWIMKIKEFFSDFDINPISASPYHGPVTNELIEHIKERNEEKRKASIEFLGNKWLLHPDNREQRKDMQ